MKLPHSLVFFAIGLVMFKLPQTAPWLCPHDFFGNSVRATWLHVMGLTQITIGAAYLLRRAGSLVGTWLERWPEMIAASMAEVAPQPEKPAPAIPLPAPVAETSLADVIPIPEEFKPAWSEQRPAVA
jgi:hypothetical protein